MSQSPRRFSPKSITKWLAIAFLLWLIFVGVQIIRTGARTSNGPADAAIVLGAAVYGNKPSPVFEERIKHGIDLLKSKKVKWLAFTGGYGTGATHAESLVARDYALQQGVPRAAIITEAKSRTTLQNLEELRAELSAHKASSLLIVTDPLHTYRALAMARGLGLTAEGSPTPTTRYRGWRTKADFLLREIYFYHVYLVAGQ